MLVLLVLIGSPIGIIHLHLIFLAHRSWNGNLWKRMREKSRTFLHPGIHHQPRVQFIQVCSELFMLCHTYIYMLFYILLKVYFAKKSILFCPLSSQIPRKVPLFYQDGLWLTLTCSRLWVLGGHSLIYLSPQLWSTAPLICDTCHKVLTFASNEFHWEVSIMNSSIYSPKKLKCPLNPL